MTDNQRIDYTSGNVYARLSADATLDAADATWTAANANFTYLVVYGDYRIRDWRFLWLRHKTVTRIIPHRSESPLRSDR